MSTLTTKTESIPRFSIENGRSLSEQVYDYLAERIEKGKIQFGDRLNIKQIAAELNLSSMPIRDAIKRLEQDGITVINPRSHCYVRIPHKQDVLNAVDARRMIESFAVRSLYQTLSLSDFMLLDSILEKMAPIAMKDKNERLKDDLESYIELDRQFHYELCTLTRNNYIEQFYHKVNMHLSMSFRYGQGVCHGAAATFSEHKLLVKYLKSHSEKAIETIEMHLLKSRDNILREPAFLALPE